MILLFFVGVFYVALSAGFILFKGGTAVVDNWSKYRSRYIGGDTYSPSVAIIVPVYNESRDALKACLFSCLNNDYQNKVVYAVDDGSTNDSLKTLKDVKKFYPQLKIIALKENVGKRGAMHAAIIKSKSDLIICVDSDSIIESGDSIRSLVQPFQNPAIHAVSGNTLVENEQKNLLTRMQAARYALAFEIEKAGQSSYCGVTCCPGCYSAYRRSAVLPVLQKWLNHSVFGVKTSYGDDRSLTRLILLNGGRVYYESQARARTNVPDTIKGFVRQQVRWKRSFASEHYLLAMGWKRLTPVMRFELVWFVSVFVLGYFAKAAIIVSVIIGGMSLGAALLLYAGFSTIHYIYVFIRYGVWKGLMGSLYGLLNDLSVEWLFWYSVATLKNNKWGTR